MIFYHDFGVNVHIFSFFTIDPKYVNGRASAVLTVVCAKPCCDKVFHIFHYQGHTMSLSLMIIIVCLGFWHPSRAVVSGYEKIFVLNLLVHRKY
jgi:hypothetical protein